MDAATIQAIEEAGILLAVFVALFLICLIFDRRR